MLSVWARKAYNALVRRRQLRYSRLDNSKPFVVDGYKYRQDENGRFVLKDEYKTKTEKSTTRH